MHYVHTHTTRLCCVSTYVICFHWLVVNTTQRTDLYQGEKCVTLRMRAEQVRCRKLYKIDIVWRYFLTILISKLKIFYLTCVTLKMSRDISVDIETLYLFEFRGSNPERGDIFRTRPELSWDPPSLLHNWYLVLFPGVKRPGRGVNHFLSSSDEFKERVEL